MDGDTGEPGDVFPTDGGVKLEEPSFLLGGVASPWFSGEEYTASSIDLDRRGVTFPTLDDTDTCNSNFIII